MPKHPTTDDDESGDPGEPSFEQFYKSSTGAPEVSHSPLHSNEVLDESTAPQARLRSEEAAYWYLRAIENPSTLRSDGREFLAWMRRSPENFAEVLKIAQLHGKLRQLKWT